MTICTRPETEQFASNDNIKDCKCSRFYGIQLALYRQIFCKSEQLLQVTPYSIWLTNGGKELVPVTRALCVLLALCTAWLRMQRESRLAIAINCLIIIISLTERHIWPKFSLVSREKISFQPAFIRKHWEYVKRVR